MEGGRKIALIAVLLVVVVVGVLLGLRRQLGGKRRMSPEAEGRPLQLIDTETSKLITKAEGEWEKLGRKGARWKHPDTDKYTMVRPIPCPSCKVLIPAAVPPVSTDPSAGTSMPEFLDNYTCPKCEEYVYRRP